MYFSHNLDALQINNLYYSCFVKKINKIPKIDDNIEELIKKSLCLGEKAFLEFLIDWVINISNKIYLRT